ncbi:hypothetical protein RU98_GL000282 [Enterococcus caccae]|nr:hypothetical protein RU98_GL000282 [Enterococcus caccae]
MSIPSGFLENHAANDFFFCKSLNGLQFAIVTKKSHLNQDGINSYFIFGEDN